MSPLNPVPPPSLRRDVGKTLRTYRDLVIFVLGGVFASVLWIVASVAR